MINDSKGTVSGEEPTPENTEPEMNEVIKVAALLLNNPKAVIAEWVEAMNDGTLNATCSFQVYAQLAEQGPANDYDGVRSTALALQRRFDQEILPQAQLLRNLWISSDNALVFGSPTAAGWVETDCGPNFLTRPDSKEYLERVLAIRVHVNACDGAFKKTFTTVAKAHAYCKSMGFGDGGVTDHGTARFDGTMYCVGKTWFASPAELDVLVLGGKAS